MQEFQMQHFVEEFEQIQLEFNKEIIDFVRQKKTNQDKQNSFHNLKQLFSNPK
jgi:hypothetical protein